MQHRYGNNMRRMIRAVAMASVAWLASAAHAGYAEAVGLLEEEEWQQAYDEAVKSGNRGDLQSAGMAAGLALHKKLGPKISEEVALANLVALRKKGSKEAAYMLGLWNLPRDRNGAYQDFTEAAVYGQHARAFHQRGMMHLKAEPDQSRTRSKLLTDAFMDFQESADLGYWRGWHEAAKMAVQGDGLGGATYSLAWAYFTVALDKMPAKVPSIESYRAEAKRVIRAIEENLNVERMEAARSVLNVARSKGSRAARTHDLDLRQALSERRAVGLPSTSTGQGQQRQNCRMVTILQGGADHGQETMNAPRQGDVVVERCS